MYRKLYDKEEYFIIHWWPIPSHIMILYPMFNKIYFFSYSLLYTSSQLRNLRFNIPMTITDFLLIRLVPVGLSTIVESAKLSSYCPKTQGFRAVVIDTFRSQF